MTFEPRALAAIEIYGQKELASHFSVYAGFIDLFRRAVLKTPPIKQSQATHRLSLPACSPLRMVWFCWYHLLG